ncbi:MAG TPA: putative metallopeptidase, partial [Pirellulaceae bacterium]|nr:putative metallopeptidase [Pirellulaceae bacterium]
FREQVCSRLLSMDSSTPVQVVACPFDFTLHLRRLCDDIVSRLSELAHIDMGRVAVCFCQTRKPVPHGMFASLTPLRFAGGAPTAIRRGRQVTIQRVHDAQGLEMLYVLGFYLPRFQNLDFREKLITVLHELWHISPDFSGDIRRHSGRYHAHTHSQAEYDEQMGCLADRWLAMNAPEDLWRFLHDDFRQLSARHGGIVGLKIRRPRILPATS